MNEYFIDVKCFTEMEFGDHCVLRSWIGFYYGYNTIRQMTINWHNQHVGKYVTIRDKDGGSNGKSVKVLGLKVIHGIYDEINVVLNYSCQDELTNKLVLHLAHIRSSGNSAYCSGILGRCFDYDNAVLEFTILVDPGS